MKKGAPNSFLRYTLRGLGNFLYTHIFVLWGDSFEEYEHENEVDMQFFRDSSV
jgi:hypothetical protein